MDHSTQHRLTPQPRDTGQAPHFSSSTHPALSSRPAALSLASALAGRSSEHTAFARDPFRRGSIATSTRRLVIASKVRSEPCRRRPRPLPRERGGAPSTEGPAGHLDSVGSHRLQGAGIHRLGTPKNWRSRGYCRGSPGRPTPPLHGKNALPRRAPAVGTPRLVGEQ